MADTPQRPEIGDWVAFYANGYIVYGRVAYPSRTSLSGNVYIRTSAGEVMEESVLEVRRADG